MVKLLMLPALLLQHKPEQVGSHNRNAQQGTNVTVGTGLESRKAFDFDYPANVEAPLLTLPLLRLPVLAHALLCK